MIKLLWNWSETWMNCLALGKMEDNWYESEQIEKHDDKSEEIEKKVVLQNWRKWIKLKIIWKNSKKIAMKWENMRLYITISYSNQNENTITRNVSQRTATSNALSNKARECAEYNRSRAIKKWKQCINWNLIISQAFSNAKIFVRFSDFAMWCCLLFSCMKKERNEWTHQSRIV